jgi:arylsulfatase A-like enzyme
LPPGELERWKDFMPQASPYPPDQQERVDKHRLRYRELLMSVDNALGGLMRELKARGRFDNALIIVSSDHGESFERGFLGHGGHALHEAVIRVPLLIKLPGQSSGRVISQAVSQVDIVPTIQDILGLKPLIATEGRSLKAGLESEALAPAPVFSMAMERQSRFEPLSNGRFAIVSEQHKLVLDLKSGSTELFDLQEDPGERTNLLQTRPERAKELRLQLDTALERAGRARNQALGQ